MKKPEFSKWMFVFIILFVTICSFKGTAEDSDTRWWLELGSHYNGFQDYYRKAAEFDRGKEGFMPEIAFTILHTKDKSSIKFVSRFYDPRRMNFSLEGKSSDRLHAKFSYQSFYRQLQKDFLDNLQAREAHDRAGTLPYAKMVTHEDLNPEAEYGYRRQEIKTDIDFKVPGTNKFKVFASHRSILEKGIDQHIQLNHCATCHAVSRALDIDRKTHTVSAGAELDLNPVFISYRASYRSFKSDAGPYEAFYDIARHPINGGAGAEFTTRLNYNGENVPIALYPETDKFAHNLKLKAKIGKGNFLVQYINSKTKNKTSDLTLDGNQLNFKLIYPMSRRTKLVGTAGYARFKNDPVFIDLPNWRVTGANLDWTRYSNLTRTEGKGSLNFIYQPGRKYRLSLSGKFTSTKRDDYPFQGANDKTTKVRLQAELKYRPTMKFTGRVKYYIEQIDNPFAPYNLMFEHNGSTGPYELTPDPGMPTVYYYQRDDIRYGDITNQPTLVHGFYLDLKLNPTRKFNFTAGVNLRLGTNSDEPELDLEQTTIQPKLSFNWMPSDKVTFIGSYSYMKFNQNGLAAVPMMDG